MLNLNNSVWSRVLPGLSREHLVIGGLALFLLLFGAWGEVCSAHWWGSVDWPMRKQVSKQRCRPHNPWDSVRAWFNRSMIKRAGMPAAHTGKWNCGQKEAHLPMIVGLKKIFFKIEWQWTSLTIQWCCFRLRNRLVILHGNKGWIQGERPLTADGERGCFQG